LDGLKGAVAIFIANELMQPHTAAIAGIAAVLGHMYPVWLNFKGGKGVATTLAVFMATDFNLALVACSAWLFVFYVTQISSLSAILALVITTVVAVYFADSGVFWMVFLLSSFVIYRHKENILRILRGQEKPLAAPKE
jgi:glycerol-3-phosphate acyltransferase PlsY